MSEPTLYRKCKHDQRWGHWTSDVTEPWCNGLVPVEPDYDIMADRMPEWIDVAQWWTFNNRLDLARKLFRAGIGGDDDS